MIKRGSRLQAVGWDTRLCELKKCKSSKTVVVVGKGISFGGFYILKKLQAPLEGARYLFGPPKRLACDTLDGGCFHPFFGSRGSC